MLLLLAVFCRPAVAQQIPPAPNPPQLVNDYTHMLMPAQVDALEQKLVAYNDSTSTQIAVVIVETVGDYSMVDYAVKLGREWGIGGKEFNNGLVLLIASNDHKAFIATGYGLEGALPDATCKEIIENDIVPNFRKDDYYEGLNQATNDIIAAAAGEYKAPPKKDRHNGGRGAVFIIILVLIILFIISRIKGGGGGGTSISRRGWGVGPFIGGMMVGRGLGGGGGWSGGGGGFGGGGFGGFGGGSFGGGGAGGSW